MTRTIPAILAATALSACATAPENIQASYVSPTAYSGLSCSQLNAEAARIDSRLRAVTDRQTTAANNDAAMTAVALLVFWPAAFAIQGDDNGPEIARLRGEAEAVQARAVAQGC